MMSDTFTIEQIQAAIEESINGVELLTGKEYADKVIAELTKPDKWIPQVGEVYAFRHGREDWDYRNWDDEDEQAETGPERRSLTWVEVPALQVAIEAMEQTASSHNIVWIKDALAKIKELTNG